MVLTRTDKVFTILRNGRLDTVSVDQVKTAYLNCSLSQFSRETSRTHQTPASRPGQTNYDCGSPEPVSGETAEQGARSGVLDPASGQDSDIDEFDFRVQGSHASREDSSAASAQDGVVEEEVVEHQDTETSRAITVLHGRNRRTRTGRQPFTPPKLFDFYC